MLTTNVNVAIFNKKIHFILLKTNYNINVKITGTKKFYIAYCNLSINFDNTIVECHKIVQSLLQSEHCTEV